MHLIKRAVQVILGLFASGLILSDLFSGAIGGSSNNGAILLIEPAVMILIIVGLEKLPSKNNAKPLTLAKILIILGSLVGIGLILGTIYLIYGLSRGGIS